MKLRSSPSYCALAAAGLVLFSATPAFAVFPFVWETDGAGNITGGDWMGDGIIQPNVVPGTITGPIPGWTNPPAQIAVQGFTSGTFVIDNLGGDLFSSGRLSTNPISVTHTISLTGGTADFRLHNSNPWDDGASLFNSLGLTNFNGVTAISWTVSFSEPIAARNTALSELTSRPMGTALALITAGTGQDISSFTVGMDYTQIYHAIDGEFFAGVPAGATPFANSGFGSPPAGSTSFSSDAFNAIDEFLLVRGYDFDGVGGYSAGDAPLVYMREMTWTITRDDNGVFASDTLFTMSMDGQQYSNVNEVIPEPTSVLLFAGSMLGMCLRRRRRD